MSEKKETIYQLLTQKPWESKQAKVDDLHDGKTFNINIGKFGLRYIMVVSTIMFCLFIVTYSDRMVYADWKKMPEPFLLWINTIILVLSSIFFVRIQFASKQNNFAKVKNNLLLVGILAFVFLIGQLLVWQSLVNAGYYISGSPANAYFYLFTTLHGLHLLGGLIYWILTLKNVWNLNDIVVRKAKQPIRLVE